MGRFYGNGKGESRELKQKFNNESKSVKNAQRKVAYLKLKAKKEFSVDLTYNQLTAAFISWTNDPNRSSESILKGFNLLAQEGGNS